jgi:hypothetical protein
MSPITQPPLNEAQVEILKLFSGGLTPSQVRELRQLLISFKFKLLDEAVEKAAKQRNLTDADIENALSEHWRTPYVRKATGQFVDIVIVPPASDGMPQTTNLKPNANPLLVDANGVVVVVPLLQPLPTSSKESLPKNSSNPSLQINPDSQPL